MCEFFSCVALREPDGSISLKFTALDSHEVIIRRAHLRDDDTFLNRFARLECIPPFNTVYIDEREKPGWLLDVQDEVFERVKILARRVKQIRDDYQRARLTARDQMTRDQVQILDEYEAVIQPARTVYDAEAAAAWDWYEERTKDLPYFGQARYDCIDAREARTSAAFDAYQKTIWVDQANKELALDEARAKRDAAREAAEVEYERAHRIIEGYLPKPDSEL